MAQDGRIRAKQVMVLPSTSKSMGAKGGKRISSATAGSTFRVAKTSWWSGTYQDTDNRRRLSSNVVQDFIEIQCADYCDEIESILASPAFTEKLSEVTGDTAVVNQGSIMIAPAAADGGSIVSTTRSTGGESTHTHSEEEFEKYENATIALCVLLVL